MAVAPTGAIYKALKFDNVSSRTYGVYITGEAVYNAPERDVEMITIPGRSGSFALDNGRFENIEVSYPAGIFAETEADFRQAISDFRNFLCSRKGYVRLQDEYNPDEYRMAVYKSGLDVDPAMLRAGEFTITFDCKPQRWLTSGETAVTVTSGDTLTNPTLFEASPLLEVVGYGNISVNDGIITIKNEELGEISLTPKEEYIPAVSLDTANLNTNDRIYALSNSGPRLYFFVKRKSTAVKVISIPSVTNGTATLDNKASGVSTVVVTPSFDGFVYGTSNTVTTTVEMQVMYGSSTRTCTLTVNLIYDGADGITFQTIRNASFPSPTDVRYEYSYWHPIYYGYSTKSALPTPMYIDLEIGEAYGELSGTMMSFNNLVSLPAELPTLGVGANEVTFDNTITELKVQPRWWKV